MGEGMNPDCSLASSFPRRRESSETNAPQVRGCCRFIGFGVNSTRSLLRSGLPAFGATTAYPLRVRGQDLDFVPLRGDYSTNWIPAFAGMTLFLV